MSYRALNWVRTLNILMPNDRYVMLELANHVNHKTLACHPSLRTLAKETRLSLNTVRACIDRLVESGFLAVSPYIQKGARAGTNYTLVGFTNSEGVSIAEGVSTIDTGSMTDTRVYQPLDEGISTIDTGVYQPLLPNREYKQGNKQVSNTQSVVCAENENTTHSVTPVNNFPVDEPDYDSAPFFDPIPMEAYAEEVQPPVKPKKSTTKAKKSIKLQKPEGMSEDALEALIEHRKAKDKPMTQRALDLLVKEFDKAGMGYDEAVDFMIFKGWTGLKADWDSVKNRNQTKTSYQANGKGYVSTYAHLVQNYYYEDDKFVYYIDHDSWQPDDKDPLHSFEPTDMMELNGMGFYRQQIQKIAKSELDEKKKVKNLSTDS